MKTIHIHQSHLNGTGKILCTNQIVDISEHQTTSSIYKATCKKCAIAAYREAVYSNNTGKQRDLEARYGIKTQDLLFQTGVTK